MVKLKRSLLVVVAVLVAGLLITGGCGLFGDDEDTPEGVVRAYFEAFQNKDFRAAFDLVLDGGDIDDAEIEMLEAIFEEFEIKSFEIEEVNNISSTEAIVSISITTAMGEDESEAKDTVRVVLVDGKWYIDEGEEEDEWERRDEHHQFDTDPGDDFFDEIDPDDLDIEIDIGDDEEDDDDDEEDEDDADDEDEEDEEDE